MPKNPKRPPAVDLARVSPKAAAAARADPWGAIRRFLDVRGYARSERGREVSCRFDVVLRGSAATFDATYDTIFTGDITSLSVDTRTTRPSAIDPPAGYEKAVSMRFEREPVSLDASRACSGHVNLISKKPSQGVASGTDALGIAVALGRLFGCRSLALWDASRLPCEAGTGKESNISLRTARILSKGAGWYESHGFRSLVEALEPRQYARTVGRLHSIPLDAMRSWLEASDAALRAALCASSASPSARPGVGALRIAKYKMDAGEPDVADPPSVSTVVDCLRSTSVALDVLFFSKNASKLSALKTCKTLGDAVEYLIGGDCVAAGALVGALLPSGSPTFDVVVRAPDGSAVPPPPLLDAWVFAWRLTSTYNDLTLTL